MSTHMKSALLNRNVIEQYLVKEVSIRRVTGHFTSSPLASPLYINHFAIIPKHGCPRKWWLITDLSSSLFLWVVWMMASTATAFLYPIRNMFQKLLSHDWHLLSFLSPWSQCRVSKWTLILLCNWYLNTFFFFEGLVYLWVLWNKRVFDYDYWVLKVTTQRQFLTPAWMTPSISSCKKAMECCSTKSTSAMFIIWSPSTLTIASSECPGTTSCMSTWLFPSSQLPSYLISLLKLGIGSSTIDTAFAISYTTWMII